MFHVANAFVDAGIVLRRRFGTQNCGARTAGSGASAALWEWRLNLADGTVAERRLDDRPGSFRIDDRLAGLPARYTVAVTDAALVRYDLNLALPWSTASPIRAPVDGRGCLRARPDGPADEQRLVSDLRLRRVAQRQRSGDSRRRRLRRPAGGADPAAAASPPRIPRELDQRVSSMRWKNSRQYAIRRVSLNGALRQRRVVC